MSCPKAARGTRYARAVGSSLRPCDRNGNCSLPGRNNWGQDGDEEDMSTGSD